VGTTSSGREGGASDRIVEREPEERELAERALRGKKDKSEHHQSTYSKVQELEVFKQMYERHNPPSSPRVNTLT